MECNDCEGKGFKEYDAGIVQIGCKTCEMTGKVDCMLTKEEFEVAYAFRNDMTVSQVADMGLEAMPIEELPGWAMQSSKNAEEVRRAIAAEEEKSAADAEAKALREAEAKKLEELQDDSNSGTGPDNQSTGSANTGKPKQPKKPKAKKPAKKKSS